MPLIVSAKKSTGINISYIFIIFILNTLRGTRQYSFSSDFWASMLRVIPVVFALFLASWELQREPRGRRIPSIMMEAQVPVVPHWLCRLSYGDALTGNMFCGGHFLIGGVSSCQGDSGGPAVFRGTAFGKVSFARGCALPLSPTVFTNTAALRDWITDNTGV